MAKALVELEHYAFLEQMELAPLKDLTDVDGLWRTSIALVAHLRAHLEAEERGFLNPRVLRDDVITVGEGA